MLLGCRHPSQDLRASSSGPDGPAGDAVGAGVGGEGQEGRAHHHLPRLCHLEGEGQAGGLLQAAALPHPRSQVCLLKEKAVTVSCFLVATQSWTASRGLPGAKVTALKALLCPHHLKHKVSPDGE